MGDVLRRYRRLKPVGRIALQAIVVAVVAYATALVDAQVASVLALQNALLLAAHAIGFVVVVSVLVGGATALRQYVDLKEDKEREVLNYAHSLTDRLVAEAVRRLPAEGAAEKMVMVPHDPSGAIDLLVENLFRVLDAKYANPASITDRIEFEVTVMTKSKSDGEVTIHAWANRGMRRPPSQELRRKDLTIYRKTVTAQMFDTPSPRARIVEDTHDPKSQYAELYPDQKSRIKSSIIYPILSSDSVLLATLVAHCDRSKFFLENDRHFWQDLLEIFASRIALELCRLDESSAPAPSTNLGPDLLPPAEPARVSRVRRRRSEAR